MKTIIKVAFSENSKTVLADTKVEIEYDDVPSDQVIQEIQRTSKAIFEDAQNYALTKTMRRA